MASARLEREGQGPGCLHVTLHTHRATPPAQILVVDKSGSMSGSSWKQVVAALTGISESPPAGLTVVLYDTVARVVKLADAIKANAGGGTDFAAAFQAVHTALKGPLAQEARVVVTLMTDGEHCSNSDPLAALDKLTSYIHSSCRNVVFHAIGFHRDHDVNLLERVRVGGTEPGVYRYASREDLRDTLQSTCDFVASTAEVRYALPNRAITTAMADVTSDGLMVEDWVEDAHVFNDGDLVCVGVGVGADKDQWEEMIMPLTCVKAGPLFQVRKLARSEIKDMETLEAVQKALNAINVFQRAKEDREALYEERAELQKRLDAMHRAMAESARGDAVVMIMRDLRYAANFSKARRQRRMDVRVVRNSSKSASIESKLKALTPVNPAHFANIDLSLYRCDLSTEDVCELMTVDSNDVLGFGLNVKRAEHVVDAPSLTQVVLVGATFCSRSAIEAAIKCKINITQAPESVHGGFLPSSRRSTNSTPSENEDQAQADEERRSAVSSAFAGRAREPINAFLPMFVCDKHFERVEVLLEHILAYFFTLDPLGFEGNQYVALFSILGQMVALYDNTQRSSLILREFREVCRRVLPKARAQFGGDLVDKFVKGPANRTKGVVQNLYTALGWECACTSGVTRTDPTHSRRFKIAFMEEAYRRQMTHFFEGKPREHAIERLKVLLYGDTVMTGQLDGGGVDAAGVANNNKGKQKSNSVSKDKEYAHWGQMVVGYTKKKAAEPAPEDMPEESMLPNIVLDASSDLARAAVNSVARLVDVTFAKKALKQLTSLTGVTSAEVGVGEGDEVGLRRAVLLQAVRYSSNAIVNEGVGSGTYLNTLDEMHAVVEGVHAMLEQERKLNHQNAISAQKVLERARRAACTTDIWSFVGRFRYETETRGGPFFDNICALLQDTSCHVPLRSAKVEALLLGNIRIGESEFPFLNLGNAWNMEPPVADRFKAAIGEEEAIRMQLLVIGRTANHVYRMSDIPNRHGFHNSHPNPKLTCVMQRWGS